MTEVDWHWAVSNVGPEKLLVWLEPWAEEFAVPARSIIALRCRSEEESPAQVEVTADHIVVWANGGQTALVFIDDALQQSASALISVPAVDGSMKDFLTLIFDNKPSARLGGVSAEPRRLSMWQRAYRRLRL